MITEQVDIEIAAEDGSVPEELQDVLDNRQR